MKIKTKGKLTMKNKLIKSTVLCIALAIIGLMLAGCGNTSKQGTTEERYYGDFNIFENDKETALNSSEYISKIYFIKNKTMTIASSEEFDDDTGNTVTYILESDEYDSDISFVYNKEKYTIHPIANAKTRDVECLKVFKNGVETQQMNWAEKVN